MTRKYYIAGAALIAAVTAATLVAYPHLPNTVPMHWDAHGHVNVWGPKWSLFVINPGIMAGILLLFSVLPWLSPRHFEVDSFRSTYLYIMVVVLAMLAYRSDSGGQPVLGGGREPLHHRRSQPADCAYGKRPRQSSTELLRRSTNSVDDRQRTRVERHAPLRGQDFLCRWPGRFAVCDHKRAVLAVAGGDPHRGAGPGCVFAGSL